MVTVVKLVADKFFHCYDPVDSSACMLEVPKLVAGVSY